jgi:hypothetical protein
VALPFLEQPGDVVQNFQAYAKAELEALNQRVLRNGRLGVSDKRPAINRETGTAIGKLLTGILRSERAREAAPKLVRSLLQTHLANIVHDPESQCWAVVQTLHTIDGMNDEGAKRAIQNSLLGDARQGHPAPALDRRRMLAESDYRSDILERWQGDAVNFIQGLPQLREAKELPELVALKELQARYPGIPVHISQVQQFREET